MDLIALVRHVWDGKMSVQRLPHSSVYSFDYSPEDRPIFRAWNSELWHENAKLSLCVISCTCPTGIDDRFGRETPHFSTLCILFGKDLSVGCCSEVGSLRCYVFCTCAKWLCQLNCSGCTLLLKPTKVLQNQFIPQPVFSFMPWSVTRTLLQP